jgi:hypothetical protein
VFISVNETYRVGGKNAEIKNINSLKKKFPEKLISRHDMQPEPNKE